MAQKSTTTVQLSEGQKDSVDETQKLITEIDGHEPTKGEAVKIACESFREAHS